MQPHLKNGVIAVAFVALGVAAVMGWTHRSQPLSVTSLPATTSADTSTQTGADTSTQPNPPSYQQPQSVNQAPQSYDQYGQPISGSTAPDNAAVPETPVQPQYTSSSGYVSGRYVQSIPRPVVVRAEQAPPEPQYADQQYTDGQQPAYTTQPYAERRVVRHHRRSTKKSLAIIGGSAAGGAAIGALAGGGKGAAIGALAGGAGGFIYDRLTHNR